MNVSSVVAIGRIYLTCLSGSRYIATYSLPDEALGLRYQLPPLPFDDVRGVRLTQGDSL